MNSVVVMKKCKECVFCKEFAAANGPDFACVNFACYKEDITDYVSGGALIIKCKVCQTVRRDPESCGPVGIHFCGKPKKVEYDA